MWLSGGQIRWRTVQIVRDAHYVDGYRVLHPNEAGLTFPTWAPSRAARLRVRAVRALRRAASAACEVIRDGAPVGARGLRPLPAPGGGGGVVNGQWSMSRILPKCPFGRLGRLLLIDY